MDVIRVGVVGAGDNTRKRHIPGLQAIPGVEVVVVANRSEESSRRVAESFGIPRIAPSWEEIVNDPEVDAVCVGTWPYMHAPVSISALDAGKHVLTEARMACNVAEAREMLEASKRNPQLVAQIVPSPFTLGVDATIIRLLGEGRLGKVRQVIMEHRTPAYADPDLPLTWRQNFELSGVNTLTVGIYYEAVQRWIGEEPTSLGAVGHIHTLQRRNPTTGEMEPVQIPDAVDLHAQYDSGIILTGRFSGIESGQPRNEYRIHGDRASLRVDVSAGKLYLASIGALDEEEIAIPPGEAGSWRVEQDFIDSIRQGTPVRLTSFEQGVRYMEFTEAVFTAATGAKT